MPSTLCSWVDNTPLTFLGLQDDFSIAEACPGQMPHVPLGHIAYGTLVAPHAIPQGGQAVGSFLTIPKPIDLYQPYYGPLHHNLIPSLDDGIPGRSIALPSFLHWCGHGHMPAHTAGAVGS